MPGWPSAVRSGASALWYWRAPTPPVVGQTPAVTFTSSGGTVLLSGALTPMWSPASGTISALAADRQTLTLSNVLPATAYTAAGQWGDAWIASPDGYVSCRAVRIVPGATTTTVTLAEPLPRDVNVSAAALIPAWHSRQLTAADVTATAQRGITWLVTWAPYGGGPSAAAVQSASDTGILDVPRQPFATGLSTEDLVSVFDPAGSRVPSRAQGYEAAIQAGLEQLVAELRSDSPAGLDEHDLNGPELRPVHRWLAAVYLARTAEERAEYEARGLALYHRIRDTMWVNAARNGLAPTSERRRPLVLVGGTFTAGEAARRTITDVD